MDFRKYIFIIFYTKFEASPELTKAEEREVEGEFASVLEVIPFRSPRYLELYFCTREVKGES